MNLRINDPKVDELAAELAKRTGEDPTVAVVRALEERLTRQPQMPTMPLSTAEQERRMAEIQKIVAEFNKLPVLDNRTPEEMLYDEDGLPV